MHPTIIDSLKDCHVAISGMADILKRSMEAEQDENRKALNGEITDYHRYALVNGIMQLSDVCADRIDAAQK